MKKNYLPTLAASLATLALVTGYFTRAHAAINLPYPFVDTATGRSIDPSFIKLSTVAQSAAVIVSQKNKTFIPEQVELRVGQVLEITNDDTTVHNAYCKSDDFKFNAGAQPPGKSAQVSFTKAGAYEVRCAIHPKMLLMITVRE